MATLQRVIFLASLVAMCSLAASDVNVGKIMEEHQVVPDIIDKAPENEVEVTYPSGATVNQGNELTPTQVKDIPTVKYNADADGFYTLIMSDPDAPSRKEPTYREVRHWVVVNIPGNKVAEGETLFEFIGSGPPQGTDLHRYIFLVFKQTGKLTFDEKPVSNKSRENRFSASTREFVKKYNLGDPIAGNLYQAQYDDYVPILHAQLSA